MIGHNRKPDDNSEIFCFLPLLAFLLSNSIFGSPKKIQNFSQLPLREESYKQMSLHWTTTATTATNSKKDKSNNNDNGNNENNNDHGNNIGNNADAGICFYLHI